jgi:hypothetical protein
MWIFEVRDSTGRIIHLSTERWAHIQKHPGVRVESMKDALIRPTTHVTKSHDVSLGMYYRYDKRTHEYLYVLAKYLNGSGFIITAHYTDTL